MTPLLAIAAVCVLAVVLAPIFFRAFKREQ